MAFNWATSEYNARGSWNRWFRLNISANNWPAAYTGGVQVNFEYPDIPLTFPSISVTHLGGQSIFQRHVGGLTPVTGYRQHEITDISVWASGQANAPWVRDLWQLRDVVTRLIQSSTGLDLLNIYSSTASPSSVGLIRWEQDRVEDAAAPLEASPNIHRVRLLARWFYLSKV